MINKTHIDAEIKVVHEKLIASNKRKARDHCYFNDNAVVKTFMFDKAGYKVFDPYYQREMEQREQRCIQIEIISYFKFVLKFVLVIGTVVCIFILFTKLLAGYGLGIKIIVAAFFACLAVGALYYHHQKWAAQQFPQAPKISRELLIELSTLSTLSETGRTYISKLLDQLPSETEPTFILHTFYHRDMTIYDDEVITTQVANDSHDVTEGQLS